MNVAKVPAPATAVTTAAAKGTWLETADNRGRGGGDLYGFSFNRDFTEGGINVLYDDVM